MMLSNNKLVSRDYWDSNYNPDDERVFIIDSNTNLAMKDVDAYLKNRIKISPGKKFIEIGCAPGGWLHYFYKNFHCKVDGLEYSNNGVKVTRKNLKKLGVPATIHEADLFNNNLKKGNYDLVFSSGFIEHFKDPTKAIEKHLELLTDGGYLILMIPNFRGFNYFYQSLLNRQILKIHNLKIMKKDFFEEMSERFNLEKIDVDYVGKINFGLFSGNESLLYLGHLMQGVLDRLFKVIPVGNSGKISPYIIGIFKKLDVD